MRKIVTTLDYQPMVSDQQVLEVLTANEYEERHPVSPTYRIKREDVIEDNGDIVRGVPTIAKRGCKGKKLSPLDIPDWVLAEIDRIAGEKGGE